MDWIKSEERFPSYEEEVLMFSAKYPNAGVMTGSYKDNNTWATPRGVVTGDISHWKPWSVGADETPPSEEEL